MMVTMTPSRDELIHLLEGLTDDQVEVVLADVRCLTSKRPHGQRPPALFGAGVAKEGPDRHRAERRRVPCRRLRRVTLPDCR